MESKEETSNSSECPICLSVTSVLAALVPCGHVICNDCWVDLFSVSARRCPCCCVLVKTEREVERWNWKTFLRQGDWQNPYEANFHALYSPGTVVVGKRFSRNALWSGPPSTVGPLPTCFYNGLGPFVILKDMRGGRVPCSYRDITIAGLRALIAERTQSRSEQLRLLHLGQPLADNAPMQDVPEGDVIHVLKQVRGDIGHFTTGSTSFDSTLNPDLVLAHTLIACNGVTELGQLLSVNQCAALRLLCPRAVGVCTNAEVEISWIQLQKSVGLPTWTRLRTHIAFNCVKLRTVREGAGSIPFNTDVAHETLQIFLNSPDDYTGGRVVYKTADLFCPKRPLGDGVLHQGWVPHAVTTITQGM